MAKTFCGNRLKGWTGWSPVLSENRRITEVEGGTRIHWSYTFFPKSAAARPVLATIVKLLWGPYMHKVLPGIVAEVEHHAGVAAAAVHPNKWTSC